MGDLEALIAQTTALIGELIQKPKMTAKLLSKPPFRFLHDTISAVITTTGFGEGLFGQEEMDSANIADKDAKVAYLNKIFQLVGICKGYPIDVRAIKVVVGLEPENTNIFLIALAECATDSDLDSNQAVRMCLDGVNPGQVAAPRRSGGGGGFSAAESKSNVEPDFGSGAKRDDAKESRTRDSRDSGAKETVAHIPPEMEVIAPDRGKSRGGTRGGKPNLAVADVGLSGGMGGASAMRLDAEIERCDGSEATTQALLGPLITRPKLTEKLLGKPPFKFLFDIVMEVIRATNFAQGLYSPEECDSANVTEKEQKLAFLEKIIKVVGLQLNTLVVASPIKIIAGKEPQDTNNFLQLLAVAAKHVPDASAAVRTVLGGDAGAGAGGPGPRGAPAERSPEPAARSTGGGPRREAEIADERTVPMFEGGANARPQRTVEETAPYNAPQHMMAADEKPNLQDDGGDGMDGGEKRSSRPATAGRRPPRVKEEVKQVQSKDVAPAAKKTEGIIIDGQADEDEIDEVVEETRLADTDGAEAKGVSVAAGADSKLVKSIMSRQAEQEAANAAQNKTAVEADDEAKGSPNESGGSGIRLGRLKKTGIDKKGAAGAGGGFGETDLEKMRASIQLLVQHTGPLGTCMDYIQEDISLMTAELHRWEEDCRKYEIEYEEAKRKTKESLHPLKLELAEVNDQIHEVVAKISSAKAANARNDEKIQQILKLSATA